MMGAPVVDAAASVFFFNLGIFWMNFVANVETVRDDGDL
jgi:hypothetical protein